MGADQPAPTAATAPAPTFDAGLSEDCTPYLPRGVRLHDDRLRGIRVLLAPERAIELDAIGDAILSNLDGSRNLGQLIDHLSAAYAAPRDMIAGDVREFLTGLIERRMIFVQGQP
ncbi:pyrroloquinoline quinone biosynthesis peptide chaperone PqqD [Paracoccus sp. (in: a-proteobacteria)]|uniref:pyrroloquinoline quinone biosynthesis peptide chaperone PqqD n=1 Tax=Paracoccus sp. TaxID=267 RepID=UPI00289E3B54|nr:pyrroloquinoline quinone biosynthesis peptide chaperone PqqD [Paracoccus sp. (in: a-proteobacteria)]